MFTRKYISHTGAAVLGGRIFAVGGDDGVTHLNSAECYDAQLNEWGEVVNFVKFLFCPSLFRLQ